MNNNKELLKEATLAFQNAYAPYSSHPVGSAVLTEKGVYSGHNIENACYPAGCCAERVALYRAFADGAREFRSFIVVTKSPVPCCGICLQVMTEFCKRDMPISLATPKGIEKTFTLAELAPPAYGPDEFKSAKI